MREATVLTHSARTHPQKTERKHFVHGRSVSLCYFFLLDIKQREEIEEAWRQMLLNSVRGGKKHKSRTRTESCEKERKGIMWVVMSARRAERGMGDREMENNSETQRETWEDVHQSAVFLLCTAALTHCKWRRRSRGKAGCPLKNEGEEEKKKWGKTHARSLSRPAERQWSDSEFNISSWWASGSLNPHMPSLLLQHLSPPFLCSPLPQAAPVIGCPTVLDLCVVCVLVSVYMCMFLQFIVRLFQLIVVSCFYDF